VRDPVRCAFDLLVRREPPDPDPDRRLRFFAILSHPTESTRTLDPAGA